MEYSLQTPLENHWTKEYSLHSNLDSLHRCLAAEKSIAGCVHLYAPDDVLKEKARHQCAYKSVEYSLQSPSCRIWYRHCEKQYKATIHECLIPICACVASMATVERRRSLAYTSLPGCSSLGTSLLLASMSLRRSSLVARCACSIAAALDVAAASSVAVLGCSCCCLEESLVSQPPGCCAGSGPFAAAAPLV